MDDNHTTGQIRTPPRPASFPLCKQSTKVCNAGLACAGQTPKSWERIKVRPYDNNG